MLFTVLLFFAGLLLLYYGAEYLVSGSSRMALSLGIRPLVVGMTVVAFATSMPELMVSVLAATKGSADMAAGNIVGSNIANIGLILGVAALVAPLPVAPRTLRREIPFMLLVSVLLYLFCLDGKLGFPNGLVLFLLLLGFLAYCVRTARSTVDGEATAATGEGGGHLRNLLFIGLGICGLGVGAELMVRSATTIARALGVSELVIGLSIVALGTSLPELAASLMSAWKGEMDIGVGNVIGSNLFNILFVLGLCPMLQPLTIDPTLLHRDLPVMLGFSLALPLLLLPNRVLDRRRGALLLAGYLVFIGALFL